MSCAFCQENKKHITFELYPDATNNDLVLFESEIKKIFTEFAGEVSLYSGSTITCTACGSRWSATVQEHRLPPDPLPWYYTVIIEWLGQP